MYKVPERGRTSISINKAREGEPMEKALQRMINNNEGEAMGKDVIYTRPEDGVPYGTDIRGDKFEKAIANTDKVTAHVRAARDKKYEERRKKMKPVTEEEGGKPSVQANQQVAE